MLVLLLYVSFVGVPMVISWVNSLGDVMLAASGLLRDILITSFSHFPRKISTETISIMAMQYRLTPLSGKHSIRHKSLSMKEFPESLQFLKMRAVLNPEWLNSYKSWNNAWKQHLKKGVHQKHHHPPPQARDPEENVQEH